MTVKVTSQRCITKLRGQSFRSRLSVLPQAAGIREHEYRRSRLRSSPCEMPYHLEAIGLVFDSLSFHIFSYLTSGPRHGVVAEFASTSSPAPHYRASDCEANGKAQ